MLQVDLTDWFTNSMYESPSKAKELFECEAVYMLFGVNFTPLNYELVYIGRTFNLKNRIATHEKIPIILDNFDHYKVYFKESDNSIEEEKLLIEKYEPILNVHKYKTYGS